MMNAEYILERRAELCALSPSDNAKCNVHFFDHSRKWDVLFYPYGSRGPIISASAGELQDAFAEVERQFPESSQAGYEDMRTKEIARAIAAHLIDNSIVTEKDLLAKQFSVKEIERYGDAACELVKASHGRDVRIVRDA